MKNRNRSYKKLGITIVKYLIKYDYVNKKLTQKKLNFSYGSYLVPTLDTKIVVSDNHEIATKKGL